MKKIYIISIFIVVLLNSFLYGDDLDTEIHFISMNVEMIEYQWLPENQWTLHVSFELLETYLPDDLEYKIDDGGNTSVYDNYNVVECGVSVWEFDILGEDLFEDGSDHTLTLYGDAYLNNDSISNSFVFHICPFLNNVNASVISLGSLEVRVQWWLNNIENTYYRWKIDGFVWNQINDANLVENLDNGENITLDISAYNIYDGNEHTFTIECSSVNTFNENFTASVSCSIMDLPYINKIEAREFILPVYDYDPSTHSVGTHFTITKGYTDGIGRKLQSISVKTSPDEFDIVTPYSYDFLGRQAKSFLPFVADQNNGELVTDALNEQLTFYNTEHPGITQDDAPFSEAKFEESPLNRVIEQGATGIVWQPDGNTLRKNLSTNQFEEVRKWDDNGTPDAYYAENELTVTETIDENFNSSFEYTNKAGKTILKKSNDGNEDLFTYYIYDKKGNLIYIIPPECYKKMNTNVDYNINNWLSTYITQLRYDDQNRLRWKKIPEAGRIWYTYNVLDEVVISCDGNLNADNQRMFKKYDVYGREILSGIYNDPVPNTQEEFQNTLTNNRGSNIYETRAPESQGNLFGYTNNAYPPIEDCEVLSITYYDDYDFDYDGFDDIEFWEDTDELFSGNTPFYRLKGKVTRGIKKIVQADQASVKVFWGDDVTYDEYPPEYDELYFKGENITLAPGFSSSPGQNISIGSHIKVPANPIDTEWLTATPFYDKYGRVIQIQSFNHTGHRDITSKLYDFPGKVLATKTLYNCDETGTFDLKVTKRFEYDHAHRLKYVYHQINDQAEIILIENNYNELGQLIEKNQHSEDGGNTFLQSIDFEYNIRGWLTKINDIDLQGDGGSDLFAMEFLYETGYDPLGIFPQFNGNISALKWHTSGDSKIRIYGYEYDNINQLRKAEYADFYNNSHTRNNLYSVNNLAYDLNGNIQSILRRSDIDGNETVGIIDELLFHYSGNKLIGVDDSSTNNSPTDFNDNGSIYSPGNNEYGYDANGNIIEDTNKGIDISYNHLNLPVVVDFGDGKRTEWIYNASGTKLRKTVYENDEVTYYKDYVNGCEYMNGELEFFNTDEGKAVSSASGFEYVYNLKDHLGNVRVSFKDDGNGNATVIQQDHYYPFGMRLAFLSEDNGNNNKYLFNGKEHEDDHGFNVLHYGARTYDYQLCRWMQIDPADEQISPYVYCYNNPIIFIDPDGEEINKFSEKIYTGVELLALWDSEKLTNAAYEGNTKKFTDEATYISGRIIGILNMNAIGGERLKETRINLINISKIWYDVNNSIVRGFAIKTISTIISEVGVNYLINTLLPGAGILTEEILGELAQIPIEELSTFILDNAIPNKVYDIIQDYKKIVPPNNDCIEEDVSDLGD